MAIWNFSLPTKILFGAGYIDEITNVAETFQPSKILIVTGTKNLRKLGLISKIATCLEPFEVIVYDQVTSNPTIEVVQKGIEILKDNGVDLVLALGGGSVIDAAKAISRIASNPHSINEYLSGKAQLEHKGTPLIAVPTVAGTGSEVTPYASIINDEKKFSLTHEFVYPDISLIDPNLTITTPKKITATSGLDALAHSIEAYWSKGSTPVSDVFALKGFELVFNNLLNAFNFPQNAEYRLQMSLASLFSGLSIAIARTTIVHSVSYPLTVHFGVPHGLACSLTLPSFIKYNSANVEDRIKKLAKVIGKDTPEELTASIEKLIASLELPNKLGALNIQRSDLDLIVKEGFRPDRAQNNPRIVTEENLREILVNIL